jgi:DNA-binding MarR family transcriptional regulator
MTNTSAPGTGAPVRTAVAAVQGTRPAVGLIHSAFFCALVGGAEQWAELELTMPQLKLMLLLAEFDSVPVSWLAARMHVSPPNITGILDRLEQRGWVRRTTDAQDRRVVRIVLSAAGSDLLRGLTSVVLRADTQVTDHGFRDGRATSFQSVLQRGTAVLVDNLGVPRVRCKCGNPLTPPKAVTSTPTFKGQAWEGFDAAKVVVVVPAARLTRVTVAVIRS